MLSRVYLKVSAFVCALILAFSVDNNVIASSPSLAQDISTHCHLRAALKNDPQINERNFLFLVKGGVISLWGDAKSQAEKERVIDHARTRRFAEKVITYIEIGKKTKPNQDDFTMSIERLCVALETGTEKEKKKAFDNFFKAAEASASK